MLRVSPLVTAWSMLTHNPYRFVLSSLGIAFAVAIMFMQMGFFNGINDSQANLATILKADLILSSQQKHHLKSSEGITRKRLYQMFASDEVVSVTPVYTNPTYWWNPQTSNRNRVLVIAVSLDHPGLAVPEIERYRSQLRLPNTVLYDQRSRKDLGHIQIGTRTQLRDTLVTVVGLFNLGPNFAYEGHIIVSHENYYRLFANRGVEAVVDQISLGLLTLQPGVDPEALKARLLKQLPDDFSLLTPEEIAWREKLYTIKHNPSGIIFGIGFIVGVTIGVMICYQILFNEIHDHMAQFATLKAIGHSQAYIVSMVISEALLLSVIGFLPGLLFSWGLYQIIEFFTQIIMYLTPARIGLILVLTTGICLLSSILAIYKVIRADPASLY